MASTLETCANTAARPGSPSAGDTVYQEDTKQIITYDGSSWQTYSADGTAVNDADITGLSPHCWLRADAGIYTDAGKSTAATQGQLVYTWADQAGSSFDFVQATEGNRPQWIDNTAANNRPGIVCGGDELSFTGTSSSEVGMDDYTMFWVMWIGYADGSSYYFKTSDSRFRVRANTVSHPLQMVNFGPAANYPYGSTKISSASDYYEAPQILAWRSDSTAGDQNVWVNGGTANGTIASAGSASDFILKDGVTTDLNDNATTSNPMTWYDFLLFDNSLSDAQMNTALSYFGTKYGITTTTLS
jgi:hypothetical protein